LPRRSKRLIALSRRATPTNGRCRPAVTASPSSRRGSSHLPARRGGSRCRSCRRRLESDWPLTRPTPRAHGRAADA
jgi:hypothetical protein